MRAILLAGILFVVAAKPVAAAEPADRITVTASGRALAKLDIVEVRGTVSGTATLAADALKKFRDNRRRAITALEGLKLKGLTIEGNGPIVAVNNPNANLQAIMNGNAVPNLPSNVAVSEVLSVRLSPIDEKKNEEILNLIAKIIDSAKDAGMQVGPAVTNFNANINFNFDTQSDTRSELARFRSSRLEEARRTAVREAMQAARQKAAELAESSHARLGELASVREVASPSTVGTGNFFAVYSMVGNEGVERSETELGSSAVLKPIPVTVVLEAQFAVERNK